MNNAIEQVRHLSSEEKRALLVQLLRRRAGKLDTWELSQAQQRLWFLDQLAPNNPAYNIPVALRLKGHLNVAALTRGFNEIVQRHEILRTSFPVEQGRPVQAIIPTLSLELPQIDLQSLSGVDKEAETLRLIRDESGKPFALNNGPLLRLKLLRLGQEEHILLVTMHHIVSDGWSMGVFVREMIKLYQAFVRGETPQLAPLLIQYADFAVWQRQQLQGETLVPHLAYWKQQLAGITQLQLPTDRPRPAVQAFRGATYSFLLPGTLSQSVGLFARRYDATLFTVLLAAFNVCLYRYSGQEDIVVGSAMANRPRIEMEGLIGLFVNTMVLRTSLVGDPSFEDLIVRVRSVVLDALAHQDLPFEMLVEHLRPARTLSYQPLFQVEFALQNAFKDVIETPGLAIEPIETNSETTKFDLTLFMRETPQGLMAKVEYDSDLFDRSTIERMMDHFQRILFGLVDDPTQRISQVELLAPSEREEMLIEWNATAQKYPKQACIHHLFEAQASRSPDAVAVICDDVHLTYRELDRRANQVAHHLQQFGVGPETHVAICMDRTPELMAGLLGILKAGAGYVPLDPSYPAARLGYMLADTEAPVILSQSKWVDVLSEAVARTQQEKAISPIVICLDTDWESIASELAHNPFSHVQSDNLAYVIYTSGSTGQPKGVMICHQGLVNYLTWCTQAYPVVEGRGAPVHSSISFDLTITSLFAPLMVGGQVVVLPQNQGIEGLSSALRNMGHFGLVKITPAHLDLLNHELTAQEAPDCTKAFIIGGESLLAETAAFWQTHAPHIRLVNEYGPTETVVGCATYDVPADALLSGPVPIGRPIINTQIYLLDSHLQPVPVGVSGELYVGGVGVARGYMNQASLTAERFIPDPFGRQPGARLYKTGDLARYQPDGTIAFLGRIDTQVKLRGFRIELGEIETLLAQHQNVQKTVILLRENQLVAYVVRRGNKQLSSRELRQHLQARLPEYMVPTLFVWLAEMPLTDNNKIDHGALPDPDQKRSDLADAFAAPRTEMENQLASIWAKLLKLDKVGIYDNFFELGGHSLLATQIVSWARETYHINLALRSIFETPTVADIAERIELLMQSGQGMANWSIQPVPRNKNLPLSFAQQRLWFLDQLEPGNPFYNVTVAVQLDGPLDIAILKQCFNSLVERHETLRTRFAILGEQPAQIIDGPKPLFLPVVDLSHLLGDQKQDEALHLIQRESQRSFDLAYGPLVRVTILQLEKQAHIIIWNIHHIVSDGWSMSVLMQELGTLYKAFAIGQPVPLKELPIQYADYAVWQRERLQGELLEQQLAYWRNQLTGASPILELPTDRPRPAVQRFQGAHYTLNFSTSLTASLQALSQQEGLTLFMVLLAGFNILLQRYTQQSDIVVSTPIAGRTQVEMEGLIGFLVNTLVLRVDGSGNPTLRELLQRVKAVTLGAYAHQELPFEKLVEDLQPTRNLSYQPLFQVMLAMQNMPLPDLEIIKGLSLRPMVIESGSAQFDLTLFVMENVQGLSITAEYDTDLFDRSTIVRMMDHFQNILAALVTDLTQHLFQVELLAPAERHQLLNEWNTTAQDYPRQECVHQLFEAQVSRTPDAIAVVSEQVHLTYNNLNERANQVANYLRQLGVGPETRVGICMDRTAELVVGLLAILKAGGAYVPLDPSYPIARLGYMLADTDAPVVLTQRKWADILTQAVESAQQEKAISPAVICVDSDWESIARQPVHSPSCLMQSNNLAYIMYTSGSTGQPKGVMIPHSALVNVLTFYGQMIGFTDRDILAAVTTLSFDIAQIEFHLPLIHGARLLLLSRQIAKDSADLTRWLEMGRVTFMQATPATWQLLVENGWQGANQFKIVMGGEAMPRELANRLLEQDTFLWNVYGPTETTVWSTFEPVNLGQASVSIGRPIANTQIYLLDKYMQPVLVGVPGELYIGGDGVARGYLHRPDLTAQRFIPNPFADQPGDRLYKTGDLARYQMNGTIEFLGRIDHQVKIRGYRVELQEIETLLSQHPAVRKSAVVVREDMLGDKRLVGYITINPEHIVETELSSDPNWNIEPIHIWQNLWDQTYHQAVVSQDPTLNLAGWKSSYTGEPIHETEMWEWINHTIGRIMALQPKRVLEIGCGSGLITFRVAPNCEYYCGTDFSELTVLYLQQQLERPDLHLPQVDLLCRPANNFDGIEPDSYDTVILNSVIQYFPNIEYLVDVLEKAVRSVQPGGCVFIGDVRHYALLDAFHTSVELWGAPENLSTTQLKQRIYKRIVQERELLLDPSFFLAIKQHLPQISHVQVQLKRGQYLNEMTRFRYDVILHVGDSFFHAEIPEHDWQRENLSVEAVGRLLTESAPPALRIVRVPNIRLLNDLKVINLLNGDSVPVTVGELRNVLRGGEPGIDPEALWSLSEHEPYTVEIEWSQTACECFDVVLKRNDAQPKKVLQAKAAVQNPISASNSWSGYSNDPLQGMLAYTLIPQVRRFMEQYLPEYMVPSAFVLLDQLPLTPNGKIDRNALPAPDQKRPDLEKTFVAPRTSMEEVIANIWAEVLNIEQVGVHDNFFELGGHSLLATQVVARLCNIFKVELVLRELFEAPTVAGLAERVGMLQGRQDAPVSAIGLIDRSQPLPLSFAQQRLWFLNQLEPVSAAYNVSLVVRLTGTLDLAALDQSFIEMMRRHESLRTNFLLVDGQPVQVIRSDTALQITYVDLCAQPQPDREPQALHLVTQEVQRPFDLEKDLLLRVALLRLDPREHWVVLVMHHIVSDAWSLGVLVRELVTLYNAFSKGLASPLLDLPLQYADFAYWERQWLQGEILDKHIAYWKKQLAGAPPMLNFPTDRPRLAVPTYRGAHEIRVIPPALVAQLWDWSRRENVTLFMTLVAAFDVLLHYYTGQDDIVVGTDIANRTRSETADLVGFFVNQLVLRTQLSAALTFKDLLHRVHDMTMEAYAHQDLPFDKLVEALNPERSLRYSPLFQVKLVLQNVPKPNVSLDDIMTSSVDVDRGMAQLDLNLRIEEKPSGLVLSAEYSTDLFDAATIARMLRYYDKILNAVASQPDHTVGTLEQLLAEADREYKSKLEQDLKDASLRKLHSVKRRRAGD